MTKCRYCLRESNNGTFCSMEHKIKWLQKVGNPSVKTFILTQEDRKLQEKFIKKIGKKKAKEKLVISRGAL